MGEANLSASATKTAVAVIDIAAPVSDLLKGDDLAPKMDATSTQTDAPTATVTDAKASDLAPNPADDHATLRNKLHIAVKALHNIERNIQNVIRLLEESGPIAAPDFARTTDMELPFPKEKVEPVQNRAVEGRVVEGVFDGQHMVGSDGKAYLVPANYASKSKLVEGDMLKLTITPKGSFIYKQIGPIDRSRLVGTIGFDPTTGEYYATSEKRRWSVLKASVTYFKGESGDEVVLLVPKNAPSRWAAVENIMKKDPLAV